MIKTYLSFSLLICLVFSQLLCAQQSNFQIPQAEQQKMMGLVRSIYQQFQSLPFNQSDLSSIIQRFNTPCTLPSSERYYAESLRAKADEHNNDWGVDFRGRFLANFNGQPIDDTDIGDEESGSQGYVELSWELLNGGLYENHHRAKSLYQQAELVSLQAEAKQITNTYRCLRQELPQLFIGFTHQVLQLRLEFMQAVYAIERRAYFKGWSQFDDLLVSKDEIVRIQHELDYIKRSPFFVAQSAELLNPPLVDININKLLDAIAQDSLAPQLAELQQDILRYKDDKKIASRLRVFVRENLLEDDQFGHDSANIGVRFSVPLTWTDDDELQFQLLQLEKQAALGNWERISKVRDAYQQIRYQQKQTIKQYYRYQRALERFRQAWLSVQLQYDERELVTVLTRLRTLLDASFELIETKQILYRRVNALFLQAQLKFSPEFISHYELPTENNRGRIGQRKIYLWSKTFNRLDNKYLLDFMQAKGIATVLLSDSKKINKFKKQAFLQMLKQRSLKVELMIGSNQWTLPQNHARAVQGIARVMQQADTIHLDIEPHTFADFKQHKQRYLNNYIAMLTAMRKQIGTTRLTVAVPLHWPIEFYQQTAMLVEGVYIMAYGSRKPATLIRRLSPVVDKIGAEKITVILRIKDFKDEWEIEKMTEALHKTLHIQQFGFENFNSFFTLSSKQEK
ncbi:MAG: hypothetical protein GQ582_10230 [Methyloprofundus sp.]|nr:hypothetical protein [Methyloprofundus sp.]